MSQLTNAEECPSELIVAKACVQIHNLRFGDANFEFMLCPGIRNYLPIVNTLIELNITKECPEEVVLFFEVDRSLVWTHLQFLLQLIVVEKWAGVPDEVRNHNADDLTLETKLLHLSFHLVVLDIALASVCIVV